MKQSILDAVVVSITGTEFADGMRIVKISLEQGYSFMVRPDSVILRKMDVGMSIDLDYKKCKHLSSTNTKGEEVVWYALHDVRIRKIDHTPLSRFKFSKRAAMVLDDMNIMYLSELFNSRKYWIEKTGSKRVVTWMEKVIRKELRTSIFRN